MDVTNTRGVVRTRAYQVFVVVAAVAMDIFFVAAVIEPNPPARPGWSLFGVLLVVVPLLVAARALRISVAVTDQEVIIRNLLRTRRLPQTSVIALRPVAYQGVITCYWPSPLISTVRLTMAAGRPVTAYCLVGRPSTAARAAAELHALVGLPAQALLRQPWPPM
jgi:hypothetical protein